MRHDAVPRPPQLPTAGRSSHLSALNSIVTGRPSPPRCPPPGGWGCVRALWGKGPRAAAACDERPGPDAGPSRLLRAAPREGSSREVREGAAARLPESGRWAVVRGLSRINWNFESRH